MHVSNLKKLAPLWYELSVQMKADREADAAFGWMLEMWGYSVAALREGQALCVAADPDRALRGVAPGCQLAGTMLTMRYLP